MTMTLNASEFVTSEGDRIPGMLQPIEYQDRHLNDKAQVFSSYSSVAHRATCRSQIEGGSSVPRRKLISLLSVLTLRCPSHMPVESLMAVSVCVSISNTIFIWIWSLELPS